MTTNALIDEKSPYLRQHANNPVAWLPWGETAFRKAQNEQKPIFLSIGYSTCHWCHVMAHESFENEAIAAVLNQHFVPIKIDREERPDVDRIYMTFVQASTGSGGWPLSVWLTPELKPFFGGTYFPPDSRYGRAGFKEVLEHLSRAWDQERDRVLLSGENVTEQLRSFTSRIAGSGELNDELFESGFSPFRRMFDPEWGGFGSAPKFPRPVVFNYLLRYYANTQQQDALDMVVQTLHKMAAGGMHDQLGGGFHRYSVDERWFVPHFEKMLYDQAQLAIAYLEAFQITRDEKLANVARGIFEYVLRDLRHPEGAFYSAEDADSPDPERSGHSAEGAFYLWKQTEIEAILGKDAAAIFNRHYGVEPDGNVEHDPQGEFVGRNILYEALPVEDASGPNTGSLSRSRSELFQVRSRRPRPHLDNKVLTSWNGLMISALAKGYSALGDQKYREAAEQALDFILSKMYDKGSNRFLRRFCEGEAAVGGFLDDYAFLAQALLDTFEVTFAPRLLEQAIAIARDIFPRFEDDQNGGFYSTETRPDLLLRMKDDYDGAEPTGNSVATDVLVRLARLTENEELRAKAERSLKAIAPNLKAQPSAGVQMLVALGKWLSPPAHVVIRCEELNTAVTARLFDEWKSFEPNGVTLVVDGRSAQQLSGLLPILTSLDRKETATIFRCVNYTCALPETLQV